MAAVIDTDAEIIDMPLNRAQLAERFRALCDDPRFANLPGKVELDPWGRILMSPASNAHGFLQAELARRLAALDGKALVEASVTTSAGVFVADVAWVSAAFLARHGKASPFPIAPEICIEVTSPSNSTKELREKVAAYLDTGAVEVWIVYPRSKRIEYFGSAGLLAASAFAVDLDGIFD